MGRRGAGGEEDDDMLRACLAEERQAHPEP